MGESRSGAAVFLEALEAYGIEYLFGNPGTTELAVMDALSESGVEYRLALHEDIAVGMAAGYAIRRRYHAYDESGVVPVGVVNLHVAPGVAHGLANLNEAGYSGAPVVVTAGEQELEYLPAEPILSGDLVGMTSQFTKWSATVPGPGVLPMMLRRAFRVALTPPTGPVFLGLPLNAMLEETSTPVLELGSIPSAGAGDPGELDRVAERVAGADEVGLVVGDHVARAGPGAVEECVRFAEAAGARVYGEMFANEIGYPTDHDHWLSFLPPVAEFASGLLSVDLVVFAGCSTNTPATKPEVPVVPDETVCVHVGPDPWEVGKSEQADGAVVGDPGLVMGALADRVDAAVGEAEREARAGAVRGARARTREKLARVGVGSADDPRPSRAELVDGLLAAKGDAVVVDESITSSLVLLNRGSFSWGEFIGGKGGGLGYGLPVAVGAALAEADRAEPKRVLAFIGDGSYLYYPQTVYTAARYGLDITVVVPDNRGYRILKDNTITMLGGSEEDYEFVGMDFEPAADLVGAAEAFGARGSVVREAAGIAPAIREAVARDGVDVVDVLIQD